MRGAGSEAQVMVEPWVDNLYVCDAAAFVEGPANRDVRRLVKIHTPSVDPDDSDGLGRILRRSKDRATIDDVIARRNINNLFGELPRRHFFGPRDAPSPKQKCCPHQSEHHPDRGRLTLCATPLVWTSLDKLTLHSTYAHSAPHIVHHT